MCENSCKLPVPLLKGGHPDVLIKALCLIERYGLTLHLVFVINLENTHNQMHN